MSIRKKILEKKPLSDEEIRQLFDQKKEYLVLHYLGYFPLIYGQELWLVNSGMKKALRKQVKVYGLSYPQAEVDFMKPENMDLIKILIKEQMVCREAEIALKRLGIEELETIYRKKHGFFLCER